MRKFSGNKQLSALADNRIAIDKNVAHGADAITQSIIAVIYRTVLQHNHTGKPWLSALVIRLYALSYESSKFPHYE